MGLFCDSLPAPQIGKVFLARMVGRAVLCAPSTANERTLICEDGAHGVTRPTIGRLQRLAVREHLATKMSLC
jgi:hypothetical protein